MHNDKPFSKTPVSATINGKQVACFDSVGLAATYISSVLGTSARRVYQRLISALNSNQKYRGVMFSRVLDLQFSSFINELELTEALLQRAPHEAREVFSISKSGDIQSFPSILSASKNLQVTPGAIHQALDSKTKRGFKLVKELIWTSSKKQAEKLSSQLKEKIK